MSNNYLQGLILAAGIGKRLGNLQGVISKPLLPVAGKTLIEYMMGFCRSLGVIDLIVVGGFKYDELEKVVQKADPEAVLARNDRFELQNILSFKAGLDKATDEDLFVCNADYIFMDHTVEAVKADMNKLCVYASYDIEGDVIDVMKVKVTEKEDLIEMSKQLVEFDSMYTGMFFIPKKDISVVRSVTDEIIQNTDLTKVTVELLFKALLEKGHTIRVADVGKPDWFEIDTPEEWEIAKKALE